jgi:SPP1 family predicted phage head-tail adaptor
VEIGNLNQRIVLEKPIVHVDEVGNHRNEWKEYFRCWSYVTVNSSSEETGAGVTSDKQTLVFYIRESKATRNVISTSHRIIFRGTIFDIDSVEYDFNRKDYIKITAWCLRKGDDFNVKQKCFHR